MILDGMIELSASRKLDARRVFQGFQVSIENKRGSIRQGVGKDGIPWRTRLTWDYGYIRKTEGVDGDHVDCFIGPNEDAKAVYVIHVKEPSTGKYDEDKCMLGFDSAGDAKEAFIQNYDDPKFFGGMSVMPLESFRKKVFATKEDPKKLEAGGPGSGRHPELDPKDYKPGSQRLSFKVLEKAPVYRVKVSALLSAKDKARIEQKWNDQHSRDWTKRDRMIIAGIRNSIMKGRAITPILTYIDPAGRLQVEDGIHRLVAHWHEGEATIAAHVAHGGRKSDLSAGMAMFKIGDPVTVNGLRGRGVVTKVKGRRVFVHFRNGWILERDQSEVNYIGA